MLYCIFGALCCLNILRSMKAGIAIERGDSRKTLYGYGGVWSAAVKLGCKIIAGGSIIGMVKLIGGD